MSHIIFLSKGGGGEQLTEKRMGLHSLAFKPKYTLAREKQKIYSAYLVVVGKPLQLL